MSRKTHLSSLRKVKIEQNLFFSNYKNYIVIKTFLNNFLTLLNQKQITITNKALNYHFNKLYFYNNIFINTRKIIQLKKKLKTYTIGKKHENKFNKLFLNLYKNLRLKFVVIHFKFLNKLLNKKIMLFLLKNLKKFLPILFKKKIHIYLDLLKMTVLFLQQKIDITTISFTLGKIFQMLPKTKHKIYFKFIHSFFSLLIFKFKKDFKKIYPNLNYIKGCKFQIFGKLKGKTRASKQSIKLGKISLQAIESKILFTQNPIFTNSGVFGMNIWVNLL